jgi:hypothetical protein
VRTARPSRDQRLHVPGRVVLFPGPGSEPRSDGGQ